MADDSLPIFPDCLLDTSREASIDVPKASLPWRSAATPDRFGNVWVSAFQTNAIIVRARSRYKGRVIAALAIVKDAHRKSDRQAMEEVEDHLRLKIGDALGQGLTDGRAYFYEPPKQRCRCNDLIA